ncbi:MAG: TerB family tellurite resistance protein [Myxococcales bacterium]|nr:TerB family tellurite resistance protein [Myxococcales bacterium]
MAGDRSGFVRGALGPVGEALGAGIGGWMGQRGNDLGPSVQAVADVLEDPDGAGFVLQAEDPVPTTLAAAESVLVRVCSKQHALLGGRAPFVDDDGNFALLVPFSDGQASFFVAWGAVVQPPEDAVILVLYLSDGEVLGHTGFEITPGPPTTLSIAGYLRPFALMAMAIARADGVVDPAELRTIRLQLRQLFELPEGDDALIARILEEPAPSLGRLTASLSCRFPGFDAEELFFGLIDVAASDGQVDPSEVQVLQRIAQRLQIGERAWRRWATKMGVDLPAAAPEPVPTPQAVVRAQGRRVIPSVILRLDPEGQDRRNPMATVSMFSGGLAMGLMLLGLCAGTAASWMALVMLPLQWLFAVVSLVTGWLGLKTARELDGAGHGASVTGLSFVAVFVGLQALLLLMACLGLGTIGVLEEMYQL